MAATRLLPGCSAGLAERTALVELTVRGDPDLRADERFRAAVPTLCPEEPLHGVAESDWPAAFLVARRHPLGDWVVAWTVALQRWARDPVWRGRTVRWEPGRLLLAIPWRRQALFGDALDLAVRLIAQWSQPTVDPAEVQALIRGFRAGLPTAQDGGLLPNTLRFVQAAVERDIPFDILPSWVQLGWGARAERIDSSFTGHTGVIATMNARNKFKASRTLADAGLPLPTGEVVDGFERAAEVAARLGWPVVVKPLDADQGTGVVPGIRDSGSLRRAVEAAARITPGSVVVERHVAGADHRLLVVRGRLLMAVRRIPGGVTGDGVSTVARLVDRVNADPRRGAGARSLLRRLVIDDQAIDCLSEQGLTVNSVPQEGRRIALRRTANISTGGTAVDVTADIHPDNRSLAERAARIVGLDIAGIDFICTDISRSWREVGGAICEVNAQPGFRPHWIADPDRDVNGEILDLVFDRRPSRIPTAAIAGTNGKSTTAAMLQHMWSTAGVRAGVCTTQAVRIGEETISTDNLSGLPGARMLLTDPIVEAAVIEMPRKGLIYFGHPCDRYDVAALLNVQDDHIGVDGVDTMQQMADLKAEVLDRATEAVVVNADDPLCLAARTGATAARHILFAGDPDNPALADHRGSGGDAVFIDRNGDTRWIVLASGATQIPLIAVSDIPATMDGLLRCNELNAMAAAALGWAQGIGIDHIRNALAGFSNSSVQNPGRFNLIDGLPFRVLLDYAHNPDGIAEVCALVAKLPVDGRRLLCTLTLGSRHRRHISAAAPHLADVFDDFVIGCDPERVVRSVDYAGPDPVSAMLSGVRDELMGNGVPAERIHLEADPRAAIRDVLRRGRPGDLVVVLAEPEDAFAVLGEFTG